MMQYFDDTLHQKDMVRDIAVITVTSVLKNPIIMDDWISMQMAPVAPFSNTV